MKSRRWIAAAALAAAVVFLVMVTGQHGPAAPDGAPAPVASSEAVLASDGGSPDDDDGGGGGEGAERDEIVDALQGLLDALGISADELADGAQNSDCGNEEQEESGNGNSNGNGNGNDEADDADCTRSGGASGAGSDSTTITIAGFAFGQPLTVAPGATVEVVNSDAAPHNVTAGDGSFATPTLNQDDTATFTAPTTPGRYQFTCTLHPEMTGTLIVENTGERGRSRSSEPTTGSQRGGSGDHDSSRQHQTTAPGRERTDGSPDGY